MNIDKDIEKVKEIIREEKKKLKDKKFELEIIDDMFEESEKEEEIEKIENKISSLENVLKELETYKKIAYKLAEYIEKAEIMHKAKIPLDMNNPDGLSIVQVAKKDEIIYWARKEVDKDGSTNADKI